jgi:DNA repair exonuclease SbcCD ATPase subunit
LHGLGEIEINQLVDERFKQRQQSAEYEAMKEKVSGLYTENEELLDEIEDLKNQKEQLEKELDSKKNIRYYAGMLGDILESFGIAKDTIRKPLAGLMGIEETEKPKLAETDRSGIVENVSPEEERRTEIISLIGEYLRSTSNQALVKVFTIFSEIEKDEKVADTIIEYLNTPKTTSHANV